MKDLKIALVKQDVYQDLYVCPPNETDPINILLSSMGRVGMIGLFSELNTSFYIVDEENNTETQVYKKVIPSQTANLKLLKTKTLNQLPGQGFKSPGSPYPNGKFAINCNEIDWGQYDIVISLNVSLPKSIIKKYPLTLFAYMIGEANLASERVKFGYDICLNQMARGKVAKKLGVVDFPYTFVKGDSLEILMQKHLSRPSEDKGIYAEINCSSQRPIVDIPDQFVPVQNKTGQPIRTHLQKIEDNLKQVYDARYFLKIGGRNIRGNSIIEAISLGTIVLMSKDEVTHHELLPASALVNNQEEAIEKILYLDSNEQERIKVLGEQRKLVDEYIYHKPLQSLKNCLEYKRNMSSFQLFLYRMLHR